METIRGGHPDRFVNQFEAFSMIRQTPITANNPRPVKGGPPVVNSWGVTLHFPSNTPGAFPIHDDEHLVIKDIEHWKDYVHAPKLDYSQEDWQPCIEAAQQVDRKEQFLTFSVSPGIFEQCHYLMKIENCLIALYENPDEMKELIDYISDWELEYARQACKYLKPDALFHHDDWGSMISSFMSPEMFYEFIVPAYQKVYGYYRDHGVELIIHHSDSYAANLVPAMIDIGIDIWQGCTTTNNVPELIRKYGGRISFMGNVDSGVIDREDWSPETVEREVRKACVSCGKHYFIPNSTVGGPTSTYPGVYEAVTAAIDKLSKEMF
mgnify:FL=1